MKGGRGSFWSEEMLRSHSLWVLWLECYSWWLWWPYCGGSVFAEEGAGVLLCGSEVEVASVAVDGERINRRARRVWLEAEGLVSNRKIS